MNVTNPNILAEENSSGLSSIEQKGNELTIKLKNNSVLKVNIVTNEDHDPEFSFNYLSGKEQKSVERMEAKIAELQKAIMEVQGGGSVLDEEEDEDDDSNEGDDSSED